MMLINVCSSLFTTPTMTTITTTTMGVVHASNPNEVGWETVSCDWFGNDIALSNGQYGFLTTPDGCIKNCSSNQQCTHFTFQSDKKYCYMKYG